MRIVLKRGTFGVILSLLLLCSCATKNSVRPNLPAETSFNETAGRGDPVFVTLTLETGEKLLFGVDTGSPLTILDKSVEGKLGKRLGTTKSNFAFRDQEIVGIYTSPKLYWGNTQLLAGPRILTADLRRQFGARPVAGILGMDCLQHYCIQLDFSDNKIRFLNPDHVDTQNLGKPPSPNVPNWSRK